jgi:hypothetical protein
VPGGEPESDRAADVLEVQGVSGQAQHFGEPFDDVGQAVEGVVELGRCGGPIREVRIYVSNRATGRPIPRLTCTTADGNPLHATDTRVRKVD